MPSLIKRLGNTLFGLDEAANALMGGSPRETISGTVGRAQAAGAWWARYLAAPAINLLMGDPRHCRAAAEAEARLRDRSAP